MATMQPHDLTAWLGPEADSVTDEQRDSLHALYATLSERYPDDSDDSNEMESAFFAGAMVILGGTTVEVATEEWGVARMNLYRARAGLVGAMIADGSSERVLATRTGVTRTAIRGMLGRSRV